MASKQAPAPKGTVPATQPKAASDVTAKAVTIERIDPLTGAVVRDKLVALTGTARLPASAVKDLPAPTQQLTAEQVRDRLQSLTDANRLDASAIKNLPTGGGGGTGLTRGYHPLTVGSGTSLLRANVRRLGGAVPTLGGNASSGYTLTIPADTDLLRLDIKGNSNTANSAGDFVIAIDNSASGFPLEFIFSIDDEGQQQDTDEVVRGHVLTEVVSGNTTTLTIPNISGNYPSGFTLKLR